MKPRLLFISRKWPPAVGGMETHAVEIAEMLKQHFDVTSLVLPGRRNGRPPRLAAYGWFLLKSAVYCLLRGRTFEHLLLGDLLLFPAALCGRIVCKRQRRVVIVYGLDLVYGNRTGLLPVLYAIYFRLFRACQGIFSNIVAISTYTAELASQRGLSKVVVINPPLPATTALVSAAGSVTLPIDFARAKRRILQFGRLVPRKGALWFARNVLPLLPDDVDMFVAGPATNHEYLAALKDCPRVAYLGVVGAGQLRSMIQSADAVVMPNVASPGGELDVEGFGLVATETSSLGGILVASRFQGITDAVVDAVTGTLVEPGDADMWQRVLTRMMNEPVEARALHRRTAERETRIRYSRNSSGDEFAKLFAVASGTRGSRSAV